MKTRQGFVSNSSTTSFCIYGTTFLEESDVDAVCEELEKANISVYYDPYENVYVGKNIDKMEDSQTLGEFKGNTQKQIDEIFGKEVRCSLITDGWYEG